MTAAVTLDGVTCRFGGVCALDGLSLEVETGKVTGIIGPNGAGKTTLMDVVSGLLRPSAGKARVLGRDPASKEIGAIRARMGIVPQETALYDELTPVQNLEFSASLYGVADAGRRIEEVLELVGLAGRRTDRVGTFSGGMQRRLAIARALLHDPDLLLLDEPTLGVDVEARHQIWNHVRSLRDQGRTILLATNYLDEAEALCDTVAVLRAGRIVAQDSPAKLVSRAGRYLELECETASASLVREALAAHPGALEATAAGDRVVVYFDANVHPDELVRRAMEKSHLKGFRVRSPDLMEVLRSLPGGDRGG